jgi:hypothetical protein
MTVEVVPGRHGPRVVASTIQPLWQPEDMKLAILFGAGASYGSIGVEPEAPPLGSGLYEKLRDRFHRTWGTLIGALPNNNVTGSPAASRASLPVHELLRIDQLDGSGPASPSAERAPRAHTTAESHNRRGDRFCPHLMLTLPAAGPWSRTLQEALSSARWLGPRGVSPPNASEEVPDDPRSDPERCVHDPPADSPRRDDAAAIQAAVRRAGGGTNCRPAPLACPEGVAHRAVPGAAGRHTGSPAAGGRATVAVAPQGAKGKRGRTR